MKKKGKKKEKKLSLASNFVQRLHVNVEAFIY